MANGAYLDTKNNILTMADGTKIDTVTGLQHHGLTREYRERGTAFAECNEFPVWTSVRSQPPSSPQQAGQVQMAVAAKMLRMNAQSANDVAKLLEAAQQNFDRLANVAAGVGGNLDITRVTRWLHFLSAAVTSLTRVVARPFRRPRQRRELAAVRIDDQRGRHAEGLADRFEVLEHLGGVVGVIGELVDADLLQPGLRLVRIAGVDVDRRPPRSPARRACPAGRRAPAFPCGRARTRSPTGSAAPCGRASRRAILSAPAAVLEGQHRQPLGRLGDGDRRDLAAGQRRHPAGGFHRRLAGRIDRRIACQAANPVYPRQPDRDAGDAAQQGSRRAVSWHGGVRRPANRS